MNLPTTLCIDILGALLLVLTARMVCSRQLSTGLGAVWLVAVGALMMVASIPPLWRGWSWVASMLSASPVGLAVTIAVTGVVLHLSVAVSILQRQTRELCQQVSLRNALHQDSRRIESAEVPDPATLPWGEAIHPEHSASGLRGA